MAGAIVRKATPRKLLHGDHLDEVHHAQPAAKTRRTCGGQNVVRARRVVPRRLRRVVAHEHRAGMLDERHIFGARP